MWQGNYIDIHSHILPGVDDGSESMEQTVRMLHTAIKEGISTIIATPHYEPGGDNPSVEELNNIMKQVQEEALKIDKNFKLYLGNEVFYSESVVSLLKSGDALTLAGSRYVLIEFPYGADFKSIYKGINNFIYHGYIPILAHVERYYNIHRRQEMIEELIKMGCYIQMNSSSLIGGFMNTDASYNRKILNKGLVHFVASDCHCDRIRVPIMQTAVNQLLKKCDEEAVKGIFSENPIKILENTYI